MTLEDKVKEQFGETPTYNSAEKLVPDFITFSIKEMKLLLKKGEAEYRDILPNDKAYIWYRGKDFVFDKITNEYVSGSDLIRFYER